MSRLTALLLVAALPPLGLAVVTQPAAARALALIAPVGAQSAPISTADQDQVSPPPSAPGGASSICADFFGPVMSIADLGSPCRNYAARRALRLTIAVGLAIPLLAVWAVLLVAYVTSRRSPRPPLLETSGAALRPARTHARALGVGYAGALVVLLLGGFRYHFEHCPTQDVLRCRQWSARPHQ